MEYVKLILYPIQPQITQKNKVFQNSLKTTENCYLRVFGIAEFKFDVRFSKFKIVYFQLNPTTEKFFFDFSMCSTQFFIF